MCKAAHPSGGVDHQIHAAGGASSSITMLMVFVRSFVLFVRIFSLKGLILPYYKVNRRYFLMHTGVHHTIYSNPTKADGTTQTPHEVAL
jgi:hypothetical protein